MPDLKDCIMIAAEQKKHYENKLKDKTFLYIYVKDGKFYSESVSFYARNYLHLTGLIYQKRQKNASNQAIGTRAEEFYDNISSAGTANDTISAHISFPIGNNPSHTKALRQNVENKIFILPQMVNISKKAEHFGKYKGNQSNGTYIISRNNCSLVFTTENNGVNVPSSLLKSPIQKHSEKHYEIAAILVSEHNSGKFKTEYLNSNIKLGYKSFSEDLIDKLDFDSFSHAKKATLNIKLQSAYKERYRFNLVKSFTENLQTIAESRSTALNREDLLDSYFALIDKFEKRLNCSEKCEIAIKILSSQREIEQENVEICSLVDDEIKKIKSIKDSFDSDDPQTPNVLRIQLPNLANPNNLVSANGAAVASKPIEVSVPIPPTPQNLFKKILQSIKNIIEKVNIKQNTDLKIEDNRSSYRANADKNKSATHKTVEQHLTKNSTEKPMADKPIAKSSEPTKESADEKPKAMAAAAPVKPTPKRSMNDFMKARIEEAHNTPHKPKAPNKSKDEHLL